MADKERQGGKRDKGARLTCDSCGIIVTVDEACGCESCDLICCDQPMREMSCCR